jgi:endoribonuclease Dicer
VSTRAAQTTKEEVQAVLKHANEETLSTRGLIAKQDSSVIITDPREYQLELFEKAKKQNVIAVLDTGMCLVGHLQAPCIDISTGSGKTLIAVLLLRHVLDQELEDRAMGKKRRMSFFLLS